MIALVTEFILIGDLTLVSISFAFDFFLINLPELTDTAVSSFVIFLFVFVRISGSYEYLG